MAVDAPGKGQASGTLDKPSPRRGIRWWLSSPIRRHASQLGGVQVSDVTSSPDRPARKLANGETIARIVAQYRLVLWEVEPEKAMTLEASLALGDVPARLDELRALLAEHDFNVPFPTHIKSIRDKSWDAFWDLRARSDELLELWARHELLDRFKETLNLYRRSNPGVSDRDASEASWKVVSRDILGARPPPTLNFTDGFHDLLEATWKEVAPEFQKRVDFADEWSTPTPSEEALWNRRKLFWSLMDRLSDFGVESRDWHLVLSFVGFGYIDRFISNVPFVKVESVSGSRAQLAISITPSTTQADWTDLWRSRVAPELAATDFLKGKSGRTRRPADLFLRQEAYRLHEIEGKSWAQVAGRVSELAEKAVPVSTVRTWAASFGKTLSPD